MAIPAVAAKGSVTTTMKKTSVMTVIRFWEGSSSLAIRKKENTLIAVGRPKVSKLKCLIYQSTILSGILTTVLKTEKNLWTCRYRLTDPSSAAILPSNKPTKSLILTLLILNQGHNNLWISARRDHAPQKPILNIAFWTIQRTPAQKYKTRMHRSREYSGKAGFYCTDKMEK